MAQPTPYNRQFSFQDFQAQEPTTPLPGDEVDGELNAVKLTIDQTLVNLAKIQRDDGALKNGIVTQDSLSPALSIGFTFRGSWQTATNYLISDGVSVGSIFYKAKSSHLSSGANQPPNTAFWDQIADFTPLAIGADSVGTVALQDGAVTNPKLANAAVSSVKLADGAVTEPKHAAGGVSTRALADGAVTEPKHAAGGVSTRALADDAVTNAKLANMATQTLKGRATAATGDPEDLSPTQARAVLDVNSRGECYLSKSGANLILSGSGGNRLFVGGAMESIPSTPPSLAATGLTLNTLYYIYVYMNAGVMTLEASTTAPAVGAVAPYIGWRIKTGDATRTFVGMAYCVTGPAWAADDTTRVGCLSWFNRRRKAAYTTLSSNQTVSATSMTDVPAFAVSFLCWADDVSFALAQGGWAVSGAATAEAFITADGSQWLPGFSSTSATASSALCLRGAAALSEGAHVGSISAMRTSGTGLSFVGTGNSKCSLLVEVMG